MNVPPEIKILKIRHVNKALEASHALQAGLITAGECVSILDLAIDWCKFIDRLYRMEAHGPANPCAGAR